MFDLDLYRLFNEKELTAKKTDAVKEQASLTEMMEIMGDFESTLSTGYNTLKEAIAAAQTTISRKANIFNSTSALFRHADVARMPSYTSSLSQFGG